MSNLETSLPSLECKHTKVAALCGSQALKIALIAITDYADPLLRHP